MSDSTALRARLEAVQKQLEQLEASADDVAMLRATMELNEKKERLAALKESRGAREAELTRALVSFRKKEDTFQRENEAKGRPAFQAANPFIVFVALLVVGLGFLVRDVAPWLVSPPGVGIAGAVVAGLWGWRTRRIKLALEKASSLL